MSDPFAFVLLFLFGFCVGAIFANIVRSHVGKHLHGAGEEAARAAKEEK